MLGGREKSPSPPKKKKQQERNDINARRNTLKIQVKGQRIGKWFTIMS